MASRTIIKICFVLFVLTIKETKEWKFECEEIYKYEQVTKVKRDETILEVDHYVVKYLFLDNLSGYESLTSMQPGSLPQKCLFINYDNDLCGGMIIKGNLMYNDLRAHDIEIITRDKDKHWGWRTIIRVQRQTNAVSYNDNELHVYQMTFIRLYLFGIDENGQNFGEYVIDTSDTRHWKNEILNRFNAHYSIVYSDKDNLLTVAAICQRSTQPRNEFNQIENWIEYDSYFKAGGFVAIRSDMVNDNTVESILEKLREDSRQRKRGRMASAGSSTSEVNIDNRRLDFTKNLIDLWL